MQKSRINILLATATLSAIGYIGCVSANPSHHVHHHLRSRTTAAAPVLASQNTSAVQAITSQTGNLSPQAIQTGVIAYENAQKRGLDPQHLLTIIDYTKPSSDKRMLVVNMNNDRVIYNTTVAHGKNSGSGEYATRFSDSPQSDETSLGVYETGELYNGKHGTSLRLLGLERGINDTAYERAVVMHAANYVTDDSAGHSWGCPALDPSIEPKVVNTIKNGTVIVAYYPDRSWLSRSQFLHGTVSA